MESIISGIQYLHLSHQLLLKKILIFLLISHDLLGFSQNS